MMSPHSRRCWPRRRTCSSNRSRPIAQFESERSHHTATIEHQGERIDSLNETINKLLADRFGRHSEKLPELDAAQIHLFDEAEVEALVPAGDADDR